MRTTLTVTLLALTTLLDVTLSHPVLHGELESNSISPLVFFAFEGVHRHDKQHTYVHDDTSPLLCSSDRDCASRVLAVLRSLFFVCLFDQDDFR